MKEVFINCDDLEKKASCASEAANIIKHDIFKIKVFQLNTVLYSDDARRFVCL